VRWLSATRKRHATRTLRNCVGHWGGRYGRSVSARDSKLGRNVAFKVLPEVFAGDADRLLRFQREAQMLASLNHPNIAQIYGVVESAQMRGIVMELVDGETLQARLKRGSLPLDEALKLARQVADALEAAHDRGIVHRDLKPGNIMVATDGNVKVLDFGLAKAADPPGGDVSLSNSPTILSAAASHPNNVLIGTAAYMSPEQVRGQVANERSDVWAFGCVLYEMLTGRQPFTGDTITDLIGGIVRADPDWNALPTATPANVRAILKYCLQKDRRRRFRAIGDVGIELEESQSTPVQAVSPASKSRKRVVVGVASVLLLITIAAVVGRYSVSLPVQPLASRFEFEFPPEAALGTANASPFPTVSPDGRYVTFVAVSAGGTGSLWIRPVGALTAQPIAGTQFPATNTSHPFWSPDSRFIAFFARGKLQKVAIIGGPPQILCDAAGEAITGTWNKDDVILFEHLGSINQVAGGGGVSTPLRTPDNSKKEVSYKFPSFLPGGRNFVYVAVSSESGRSEVRVGALNADSNGDKPLFAGNSRVRYADPGYLLFVRAGTLMAQPFDARRLLLTGDIFPISSPVAFSTVNGTAAFDVSSNGTLVYRMSDASAPTELTWFDRSGKKMGVVPVAGNFTNPSLSLDQSRIAVEKQVDRHGIFGSSTW
jgi:eukaryotic-like serine/threonine-protein kinase